MGYYVVSFKVKWNTAMLIETEGGRWSIENVNLLHVYTMKYNFESLKRVIPVDI